MALTDQQKQEVLSIIHKHTSSLSTRLKFYYNDLVTADSSTYNKIIFIKSCVVPHITDLSPFRVYIDENVSVELPNVTSIAGLHLDKGSSISAPELTTIKDLLNVGNIEQVSLPNIKYINNINLLDCSVTLPIESANDIIMQRSTLIVPFLTRVKNHLYLIDNSSIVLSKSIQHINRINGNNTSTVIAPESTSEVFDKASFSYYKPEVILISEED